MNYYEHHIGDYDADISHLSWAEDMAYTRLIRQRAASSLHFFTHHEDSHMSGGALECEAGRGAF